MASAAAAADVAATMAKSKGQQQGQHHGQDSSSGPSSTAMRKEQSGESTVTTATTLLKPAASSSSSFPAPANANMTTLPPTAAGAAAPKYYYNRPFPPPPPPPFVFTGMPYAPHAAVPIMMMPSKTMPVKKMPPKTKASKTTTTAKKSGKEKPPQKRQLPTKATLMANNNIVNSSAPSSATAAASSSLPSAATSATAASSSSAAAPRRLKDTEFLKFVISEFKRRGFTAAIQLKPYSAETEVGEPSKKKRKRKQNNDENGKVNDDGNGVETTTETASTAAAASSSSSSSSAAAAATSTTTTTTDDSAQPTKQKRAYKKPPKSSTPTPSLSLPSFPFFPSRVIPNDKQDATWNAMYDQLCDYVKRHDGRPPFIVTHNSDATTKDAAMIAILAATPATNYETAPSSTTTTSTVNVDITTTDSGADNKKEHDALYKWTKRQLYAWNRMKKDNMHGLSLERISKLHALNFEQHSVHAAAVAAASSASSDLAAAFATATASPAPAAVSSKGVATVIVVDPDVTMKHAQKWQEQFESLKQYKELHGDINVSRNKDGALSRWCQTQRVRCKITLNRKGGVAAAGNVILSDNKSNPLTKEQFQLLEGIGFATSAKRKKYDSSVNDRKWEEKFQELVRFKEEHGHCEVTVRKGFDELKPLASWASTQRSKYKARQSGTQLGRTTDITDEQIMRLGSLGFSFKMRDDFETRFNQLCQFKKEFGHTKVPVFYTGHNNLGRWAKRMRDGIRDNEPWMDEVRKTRLLGIDFDISARRVFDHPHKKSSSDEDDQADATAPTNTDFGGANQFYHFDYSQASL